MAYRFLVNMLPTEHDPLVVDRYAREFLRIIVSGNRDEMRRARERGRPLPPLYESGVRYNRKQGPFEEYADVLTVYERGFAHCVDLACIRVAEIKEAGGFADLRMYGREGSPEAHVQLRKYFPDLRDPRRKRLSELRAEVARLSAELLQEDLKTSEIEDPSRFLGMA